MSLDHPRIVLLYQSLLGIYGDHGNAVAVSYTHLTLPTSDLV